MPGIFDTIRSASKGKLTAADKKKMDERSEAARREAAAKERKKPGELERGVRQSASPFSAIYDMIGKKKAAKK